MLRPSPSAEILLLFIACVWGFGIIETMKVLHKIFLALTCLVGFAPWAISAQYQHNHAVLPSNTVIRVAARQSAKGPVLFGFSDYGWRIIERLSHRLNVRDMLSEGDYSRTIQNLPLDGPEVLPAVFWLPPLTEKYTPIEQPLAYAKIELSCLQENYFRFNSSTFSKWPPVRIAHISGLLDTLTDFRRWAARTKIRYEIVDFETLDEARAAVLNKSCDLLLFATRQTPFGFMRVADIATRPTYLAVRKDLRLLHAALSCELEDLKLNNQHWLDDTWKISFGEEPPRGRVRVAVSFEPGFFERNDDGDVQGYVAEYVKRIMRLNAWEPDWVVCRYNNGLQALSDGRIDLMGGVTHLQLRTRQFKYSHFSAGIYQYYLYSSTLPVLSAATAGEWVNAHIAVGPGEEGILRVEKLLDEFGLNSQNGANISITECSSTQDAIELYRAGVANALFAPAYAGAKASEIVYTFLPVPWFFCTPFGRDDLRDKVDTAIVRIQSQYAGFQELMRTSQTDGSVRGQVDWTEAEAAYLKKRIASGQNVLVEMSPDVLLWKEYSLAEHEVKGVLKSFLDKMSEKTGLTFEVLPPVDQAVARQRCLNGVADIWASYMADVAEFGHGVKHEVVFSNPTVVPVRHGASRMTPGETRFAVMECDSLRRAALTQRGYGDHLVLCESETACFEAILDGRADATLAAPRVALVLLRQLNAIDEIEIRNIPEFSILEDVAFEFSPKMDPTLSAILEKAMESISPAETEQMLRDVLISRVGRTRFTALQFVLVSASLLIVLLLVCAIGAFQIAIRARRRTQDAVEAERLKSRFLSTISHEIRTPLNVLVGFTDFLNQPNVTKEQIREYTDGIRLSGQVLLSLINDVLDLSKLEAGKMDLSGQCVLADLFAVLRVMFAGLAKKKGLSIEMYLQPGIPTVGISAQRLRQILFNLISNAVKYTEKGMVRVEAFAVVAPDPGHINLTLRVSDTGIGIAPERLSAIFDPFEQDVTHRGNKVFEGTGLGLAIVKRLVDAAGGSVSCESQPGHGSVFTAFLPNLRIAQPNETEEAGVATGAVATSSTLDYSTLRVLIVDDVALNLRVFSIYLKKLGITNITQANDGTQALEILRKTPMDVVFTDMWMPKMNGADLAEAIRRDTDAEVRKTCVVAVTADADSAASFNLSNFNLVMTKPVTEEKVIRALGAVSSVLHGGG